MKKPYTPKLDPKVRKEMIVQAGITAAKKHGYTKFTRDQVVDQLGLTEGLINLYFGSQAGLRRAIMARAVLDGIPEIIGQGLALGDKTAAKATDAVKRKAIALMLQV